MAISFIVEDNGVVNQSQQASTKTALSSFLEEVNMAYTDAVATKKENRDFDTPITMNDVYNKMPSDLQSHIYVKEGVSKISLVDSSQSNIVLLNDSNAVCIDGSSGHNVVEIEIDEEYNNTLYWGEIKGTFYPIKLEKTTIELDEEHAQITQPSGTVIFR